MPELPDITVYIERLRPRIQGQTLEQAQIVSPFLLRTVDPSPTDLEGRTIVDLLRLGKRIVWCFADDFYLVLHLMIAGRLHWKPPGAKVPGKIGLAAFRFPTGTLTLTEAGAKKRASLHLLRGRAAPAATRSGWSRNLLRGPRSLRRRSDARESHAQASADRSGRL